jgi:SAM-dependent methyltransferase
MGIFTHQHAKAFYDRFGAKQDSQAFYEDPAIEDLVEHADFAHARRVVEFGCGTGRLAERLLFRELPPQARYLGLDVSDTMIALAAARLAPYRDRAEVLRSDGTVNIPASDGSVDRVVSTYVADLLSEADTGRLLEEARRALKPHGRLCLVGLTRGKGLAGRIVSGAWSAIHALRPSWVGGCRPQVIRSRLAAGGWFIHHASVIRSWGISSEILVASPGREDRPADAVRKS